MHLNFINIYVYVYQVPPKYVKLNVKQESPYALDRAYHVENEEVALECCTNMDANPLPVFEWTKVQAVTTRFGAVKRNERIHLFTSSSTALDKQSGKICSVFRVNLTREDNGRLFKCSVLNDAIKQPIEERLAISVECINLNKKN